MKKQDKWKTVKRPGYSGKHRDALHAKYGKQYGRDDWRTVWIIQDTIFSREEILLLYEDAYYHFLKNRPKILHQLVKEVKDVYDDASSNVNSGIDYTRQETNRTHYQDIAIRRCVLRFGFKFQGRKLIQIRDIKGKHPLSLILSPGRIPFHMPELIEKPELTGWWQAGSIESFYQSNKVLQVRFER